VDIMQFTQQTISGFPSASLKSTSPPLVDVVAGAADHILCVVVPTP